MKRFTVLSKLLKKERLENRDQLGKQEKMDEAFFTDETVDIQPVKFHQLQPLNESNITSKSIKSESNSNVFGAGSLEGQTVDAGKVVANKESGTNEILDNDVNEITFEKDVDIGVQIAPNDQYDMEQSKIDIVETEMELESEVQVDQYASPQTAKEEVKNNHHATNTQNKSVSVKEPKTNKEITNIKSSKDLFW